MNSSLLIKGRIQFENVLSCLQGVCYTYSLYIFVGVFCYHNLILNIENQMNTDDIRCVR